MDIKKLTLFATALFIHLFAFSSHIQTVEINAEHISGNQYKVSLKIWNDCGGVFLLSTATVNSVCGSSTTNYSLPLEYYVDSIGVNSGNSNYLDSSSCNGGYYPGFYYAVYSSIVTLPSCTNLNLSWSLCCRISSTNVTGQQNTYIETSLNTSQFPSNSTPAIPITTQYYMGASSNLRTFDFSAIDPENDSLVYSFVSAKTNSSNNANYGPGYTFSNIIPGGTCSLNSQTGELNIASPISLGAYIIVIRVDEYDRVSGAHKGFITRETPITVFPSNSTFSYTMSSFGGVSNVSGGMAQSNNHIIGCYGSPLSFDISYSQPNNESYLWSPINYQFSGVSYMVNQGLTSTMTVNFPDTMAEGMYNFYVQAIGDSSYFSIPSYDTFLVEILSSMTVSNDTTICLGDSVHLEATGGQTYSWSPNYNLTCTNCSNPIAYPDSTITYYVTRTPGNACGTTDSVTITVDSLSTISGIASQSNGSVYNGAKIFLITYNPNDSVVTAIDSTFTNSNGEFFFNTAEAEVYLKIAPDSAIYPSEIPTYYGNSGLFLSADSVVTTPCDTTTINFSTLAGVNPGGNGFMSGNVYQGFGKKDGAGDPIANVDLLLVNNQNEIVQYWKTDSQGKIQFSNLSFGEYQVFVDDPKIDNSVAPRIVINEHSNSIAYDFTLYSNTLIRTSPNSIEGVEDGKSFLIYPNPCEDYFYIDAKENGKYTLTDLNGAIIQQGIFNTNNTKVFLTNYSTGVYFLHITSKNTTKTCRVLKK